MNSIISSSLALSSLKPAIQTAPGHLATIPLPGCLAVPRSNSFISLKRFRRRRFLWTSIDSLLNLPNNSTSRWEISLVWASRKSVNIDSNSCLKSSLSFSGSVVKTPVFFAYTRLSQRANKASSKIYTSAFLDI